VHVETLIKESLVANKSKRRKGSQDPEMPSKPNRKTRLTNQLRLNSKAIFNPSLKYQQPIVIEDEEIEDHISGFDNMEKMAIHTLKMMAGDKEKNKYNKGEILGIKYVVVKTEYPADLDLKQNVMDFGPDPEKDFDGITLDTELVS
jgi:hypothetical protein